jgi:hypothetical protein
MIQKYGNVDTDDIRMKLDAIKQEPRERVQKYFERLDKLFRKGTIPNVEQKRRFLARLKPEIRKLCMVRTFVDIKELVGAATEVERVLGELGETPYEPFREEQEEEVAETIMEKQVAALNNAFVSFFKRNVPCPIASSYSTMSGGCQICKGGDHIATACPRLNKPRPKCAKYGMPHRTENCGMKYSFSSGLGHLVDECWKKPKDGKTHFGATNFLEVLLDNEETTMQQLNRLCGNENIFSHTRAPRRIMPIEVATEDGVSSPEIVEEVTIRQELRVDEEVRSTMVQDLLADEASINTDKMTENLEAVVGHGVAPSPMKHQEIRATRMVGSDAILVWEGGKNTGNTDGVLRSGIEDMDEQLREKLNNIKGLEMKSLVEEDPGILEEEKSPKLGLFLNTLANSEEEEMVGVDDTTETGNASLKMEELFANVLPSSAIEDDPVNQGIIVSCTNEQQTLVTQPASKMVDVLVEVSRQTASLNSNNSQQKMETMPLKQHSIALDQNLVTEINRKGDVVLYNLAHAGNQHSILSAGMVETNSHGDVSNNSDPGEFRHQPCFSLEPQMEVHLTDLEQAKVVVLESEQPLSNMGVEMLNKNIVEDELEKTSNAPSSTNKYKEGPRLSSVSEVIPSATTKNKESVVDPEAALCDCAIQSEFQNNPTVIKDNESSRGSGVLKTVPCVVVENEVIGVRPTFCKSSVQNKFEDSVTADKDNERSKELELQREVHDGYQWDRSRRGFQIYHVEPDYMKLKDSAV